MTELWATLAAAVRLVADAKVGFVVAALGIEVLALITMAFRWQLLLRGLGCRASLWDTLLAYSAGVCVCNITPARTLGGDACRLALIRSRADAPVKVVAASVIYDRASEAPALLVLAVLALPTLIRASVRTTGALVLVAAVSLFMPPVRRLVTSRATRWHDAVVGVRMGTGTVAASVCCSMLVWLQDLARITLIAAAFGIWLSPSRAATVSVIRLASGFLPVPGGLGVVDGALVAGFVWLGVPTDTAAALTIMERAIQYGCGTCLGGLAFLLVGGRHMLGRRAQADATAGNSSPMCGTSV